MFASDLGHYHVMAAILLSFFGTLGSALRTRGGLVRCSSGAEVGPATCESGPIDSHVDIGIKAE